MKKNLDNRELNIINRFLHGDHEAYSLLYKEHVQELFSYGKALTSNDERLKDAIQDVFYKILSNPSSLKNVQNLKYFLFKSLKNRLIDILKSEINKEAVYERIDFTVNDVTILDSLIEEEERFELSQKIKLLLEQLTFRQREAVCLRYIYNMEYEEIADLLNMNNSKSARNLVSRALEHIRNEESGHTYIISQYPPAFIIQLPSKIVLKKKNEKNISFLMAKKSGYRLYYKQVRNLFIVNLIKSENKLCLSIPNTKITLSRIS